MGTGFALRLGGNSLYEFGGLSILMDFVVGRRIKHVRGEIEKNPSLIGHRDTDGSTLLMHACQGPTGLMDAALLHPDLDLVHYLLKNNADVNAQNKYGWTAFHCTSSTIPSGVNRAVMRMLLERADLSPLFETLASSDAQVVEREFPSLGDLRRQVTKKHLGMFVQTIVSRSPGCAAEISERIDEAPAEESPLDTAHRMWKLVNDRNDAVMDIVS